MKSRFFVLTTIVALLLAACGPTPTPTPTATPFDVPSATQPPLPTATVEMTATTAPTDVPPTAAPTGTSSFPAVTPVDEPVNCRFGPGLVYGLEGALLLGESAQVFGKNSDASWWQVQNPDAPDQRCWVSASVTSTSGDFSAIGVVAAPVPFVKSVTLELNPETLALDACDEPFEPIVFTGTITTNGPTTVTWYFDTQQGDPMAKKTIEFDDFGPQEVTAEFIPAPVANGEYWVRLIVTDPNEITAEAEYEIDCS